MKFRMLVAAATLASGSLTPCHGAGEHRFGVEAGGSVPHGYFAGAARTGSLIGVSYLYMANPTLAFGADIKRHGWDATDVVNAGAQASYGPGSRILLNAWQYTLHMAYGIPLRGPVQPYVTAGAGLYNPGSKLLTPSGKVTDMVSELGFDGGGGLRMRGPGTTVAEVFATFHQYASDPEPSTWTTAGLRVTWPLRVGAIHERRAEGTSPRVRVPTAGSE